jgi:hypothetical protein
MSVNDSVCRLSKPYLNLRGHNSFGIYRDASSYRFRARRAPGNIVRSLSAIDY